MSGMLFGEPDAPKPQRIQSAKDRDDAAKIVWRRYRVAGVVCYEYLTPDGTARCGPATWVRVVGTDQRALCARHRQVYLEREALGAPRGG